MTEKTEFQARVLKKYGVIPVFDGPPTYAIVKTSVPGETFKQWCTRVLGKNLNEVQVFRLVDGTPAKGNAKIGGLGKNAELLKKIIQSERRKNYRSGLDRATRETGADETIEVDLGKPQAIDRELLYDTLADAVPERTPAVDEFFCRFADNHSGATSWADLFETLARQYAELAVSKRNKPDDDSGMVSSKPD